MKTLFALIVFLIPVFALSNGVYKDIDFSENIREGSSQYRHLLEYNAKNESEGCSDKNWYIFSFNPDDQWLELSNGGWDADSNSLYNPQNLQEVNDLLVAFNQHETAETQLYICLVTDWKITLEAIHAEQLIQNQNPTIPINDFLNHFSNDSRTLFQDLIKLRFSNILRAILENVHQGQDYGQFTKVNRVVWGETEFRANFYFGQTKLSGGVLRYWDSLPDKMNTFINKEELLEYIGFIEGHRTYYGLNSREITVRSNVEGFTEFLTGNLDPAYVPLVDQLNFESMHYVPWETIPDHLKSQDGGEAFEAAVAVAVAEIALKKAQNQGIDLLLETPQHKFIINATTTDFSELTEKKMLMLDDKLAYLAHKSGLQFYLYFKRADFLMPPQQYNVFANRVFIESGLSELEEGAVLLCFPYFMPGEDILNVGGLNLTDLPSTMPGIACSPNLIGEDFYTEVNAVLAEGEMLWDLMTLVFKHTSKPHHIHGATLMLGNFREEDYASRLFLEDMTPPDQPELVTGYMNMNDLYLYKDKRIQTVLDLEAEKLTSCLSELDLDEDTYSQCDALAEQLEAVYMSAPNGFDLVNYEYQIKERYLDPELPTYWKGGEYLAKYAILEFENETAFTAKWHTEFDELENKKIIFEIGFYEKIYDPLDALSLIPGIGEVADGAILLVGLSELIWGEDSERALMAVTTSGIGLFMMGENYVEVPLKQGKKLFIGPSIGFVTKQTIAEGADPVRVKKLFGLAESSYGSTAQKLVTTTVEDGRKLHRVILENDKLFDHIRVMPKPERQAFLAEMVDNPKVLKQIFDDASVTMKPVALWRKINAMGAPAREAIQALGETEKVTFYKHLSKFEDDLHNFASIQSDEIDAIGCWNAIKGKLDELGEGAEAIEKVKLLLADLKHYPELVGPFKGNVGLVNAWESVFDYPNVRKNPVELEYIDNHVSTTAKTFDDVAEEVPKLGTFSNWKLWNGIWKQTDNLIGTKTGQIKNLYSDASVGYRGSMATGQKFGPPPSPFDPDDFDVDAFIVSDDFAAQFNTNGFRDARVQSAEIAQIADDLEASFISNFPGYRTEPGKPFTFRVWTEAEFQNIVVPNGYKLID